MKALLLALVGFQVWSCARISFEKLSKVIDKRRGYDRYAIYYTFFVQNRGELLKSGELDFINWKGRYLLYSGSDNN